MREAETARQRREEIEKMKKEARRKRWAQPRIDLTEQARIMNEFERQYFARRR